MSVCDQDCEIDPTAVAENRGYRNILWVALAINAAMFGVEATAGLHAGSVSLQADSLDFFGDAANYGISLFVLARTMRWRASASMLKGATMGAFGIYVLGLALYKAFVLGVPSAMIMTSKIDNPLFIMFEPYTLGGYLSIHRQPLYS